MAIWKNLFQLSELKHIFLVIFILAFGFSYKFQGPATLGNWFGTFLLALILVGISIFVHELAHKYIASKFLARVESKISWGGVLVMLIGMVLSQGWIVFAAIWAVVITPLRSMKPGKPFPHLGPREQAIIALSGPMASLGVAILAKLFVPSLGLIATNLIMINVFIALFNLMPLFTLIPIMSFQWGKRTALETANMEGDFVFFGNRPLWVFVFMFALITSIALIKVGALASLIIAFILAAVVWIGWHFFFEPENMPEMKMGYVPPLRKK